MLGPEGVPDLAIWIAMAEVLKMPVPLIPQLDSEMYHETLLYMETRNEVQMQVEKDRSGGLGGNAHPLGNNGVMKKKDPRRNQRQT